MHVAAGSVVKPGPVLGTPVQMDPTDALLWCVSITAGEVAYFTERIHAEVSHEDVVQRIITKSRERGTTGAVNMHGDEGYRDLEKVDVNAPALHVLIRARTEAIDRLARFSKMAIDAGVAERQVALAERQGDMLAHVLGLFIDKMRFGPKALERAERVLPEVLMALESPATVLEMAS